MILKKKVSAITAMMALLGGVLCNSDSVAAMETYNFEKFLKKNEQKRSEVSEYNTPNILGNPNKNKNLQNNNPDENAPKKKIKLNNAPKKKVKLNWEKIQQFSKFTDLLKNSDKKSNNNLMLEQLQNSAKTLKSECENMVKQFDARFLSIIEGVINTTDNNTIKAIRGYMKKHLNEKSRDMGNAISYVAECYKIANEKGENDFYNLVAQAFLQEEVDILELFYDKFKNDTLVQVRNNCREFSEKFGNIKDKKDKTTYDSTLAEYNSRKENIEQNCNNLNNASDNSVIKYLNGDNGELLFSFIGNVIAEEGFSNVVQESIQVAESLLERSERYNNDAKLKGIYEALGEIVKEAEEEEEEEN